MRRFQRFAWLLYAGAVLGWVLTAGLLLGYVAPCVWLLRGRAGADFWFGGGGEQLPSWPIIVVWLVLVAVGGFAIWRRLRWAIVLGALAVNGAVMIWLRWDPATPCALPVLGPVWDETSPAAETVAWMRAKHPRSRTHESSLKSELASAIRLPGERAAWAEHVRTHREEVLAAWEADALGREWVEALCRRPPQGVHLYRHDDPILSFQPLRASLHVRMAYAYLRATEGARDKAIRLVLPELVAWQQLQRCEASLVHQMIAVVILKQSMKTIDAILDLGAVEPATLREVGTVLDAACPLGEVFRLGYLGEYCLSRSVAVDLDREMAKEGSRLLLETLGLDAEAIVFQSRIFGFSWLHQKERWRREYLAAMSRVVDLAAARDLAALKREGEAAEQRWSIRNALGIRFAGLAMPAFAKIAEQIWVVEDARVALQQRLVSTVGAAPPGAMPVGGAD